MKTTQKYLAPAIALFCFAGMTRADDAIEIKQRWIPGKTYSFVQTLDQASEFTLGGQKMSQKMTSGSDISMSVTATDHGKKLVECINHMAVDVDANDHKISYDSAKPDADATAAPMSGALGLLVGKEIRVALNDKDEPSDIENWDELQQKFTSLNPAAARAFNKDSLSEMIKQGMLGSFPGHPVKPGDSWPFNLTFNMPTAGKIAIKGNYTLRSVGIHDGVNCAEIGMDAKLGIDTSALGQNADGTANPIADLKMQLDDGSISGTIWFDLTLGAVHDMVSDQAMTVSMLDPSDHTQSMQMPMKQVVKMKLEKVEDTKP